MKTIPLEDSWRGPRAGMTNRIAKHVGGVDGEQGGVRQLD